MKQLRDYQLDIANRGSDILKKLSLLYLAMEVRTGKTATSMKIAEMYGAKKVLFLTRKKAVSSILEDYNDFGYQFDIVVTNHESLLC
jgi:predicted helicase